MPAPEDRGTIHSVRRDHGVAALRDRHPHVDKGICPIADIRIVHQILMVIATRLIADGVTHHQITRGSGVLALPQDTDATDRLIGQVGVLATRTRLVLIGVEADVRTGTHHEAVRCLDEVRADHRGLIQQSDTGIATVVGVPDIYRIVVVRVLQQVEVRHILASQVGTVVHAFQPVIVVHHELHIGSRGMGVFFRTVILGGHATGLAFRVGGHPSG